jgi:hypothetical protein
MLYLITTRKNCVIKVYEMFYKLLWTAKALFAVLAKCFHNAVA